MTKFKTGDIIIGNVNNNYGITNRTNKCMVLDTRDSHYNSRDIKVKMLEGKDEGYTDWVESTKFNLVKAKHSTCDLTKGTDLGTYTTPSYKVSHDEKLGVTFIRIGDATVAVPLPTNQISITVKHPDDVESDEIAKAVAYYRLAKGALK